MIRKYASYDCVSADKYGKRPVSLGLRFYECYHVCFILVQITDCLTIIYFVQVKSIEETCYAESLLPVDACASFRDSLYTDCRLFD